MLLCSEVAIRGSRLSASVLVAHNGPGKLVERWRTNGRSGWVWLAIMMIPKRMVGPNHSLASPA